MTGIAKREQETAWELRGCWAGRHEVRVTLSERCMVRTIVGYVTSVAVTGAFFTIDGWTVPTADVLGTARPTIADRDAYLVEARRIRDDRLHPDDWTPQVDPPREAA
jgi:hypothetical protein